MRPGYDTIEIVEPGPYKDGETIHFDVSVRTKPTSSLVLIVTAFRDQVLCYEQRETDMKAGFTLNTNGSATAVANVYDVVKGDYMPKAVMIFEVQ